MSNLARLNSGHCGVPQCNSYRKDGVSMFYLPKEVRNSRFLLRKWSRVLRMGKSFPNQFSICNLHFETQQVLKPLNQGTSRLRAFLVKGAFPTRNLPKSLVAPKKINTIKSNRLLSRALCVARRHTREEETMGIEDIQSLIHEDIMDDKLNEPNQLPQDSSISLRDKSTQVNFIPLTISSLFDTDKKLKTLTGIDGKTLDALVNASYKLRIENDSYMAMREKIILTMCKLKHNLNLSALAVLFQISEKTTKHYFADTIKHLSLILRLLIYWPTKEQNAKRLPKCFAYFKNVRTVLDCTEMKTVTFRCLKCRTGVYSQYKGSPTLKVLIGVSPSGSINYLSKVASGRSSDKAIFKRTDLIKKLEPGDAVMVDKGFMIGDELAQAGIELIRPQFHFEPFQAQDVRRNTRIAAARVHVERRIGRLKNFKVLSEKVHSSVIPYMDDIMTELCGLSNFDSPILDDNKF